MSNVYRVVCFYREPAQKVRMLALNGRFTEGLSPAPVKAWIHDDDVFIDFGATEPRVEEIKRIPGVMLVFPADTPDQAMLVKVTLYGELVTLRFPVPLIEV